MQRNKWHSRLGNLVLLPVSSARGAEVEESDFDAKAAFFTCVCHDVAYAGCGLCVSAAVCTCCWLWVWGVPCVVQLCSMTVQL